VTPPSATQANGVNYAKTYFTAAFGALFILVTMFLPRGIVGLLRTECNPRLLKEAGQTK
jgi:ABC-type branched-subunit amino acid transport system permease subunit